MNGGTLVPGGLLCLALLLSPGCSADDTSSNSEPTSTKSTSASSAPSNRIVFNRGDVGSGQSLVYTMNPDGSDTTSLFPRTAYGPHWAPDRSEISIFCCDDGMSAHFVNLKTGALRTLNMPDPGLETFCGSAWSPDGKRLACESYGVDDPRRNGIYSIRVTDGGGLTRITSNPGGGDIAGDFSRMEGDSCSSAPRTAPRGHLRDQRRRIWVASNSTQGHAPGRERLLRQLVT